MRTEIWRGYSAALGHYVTGSRALDANGKCYIVKGNKPLEETPIYNIYHVTIDTVSRTIRSVK